MPTDIHDAIRRFILEHAMPGHGDAELSTSAKLRERGVIDSITMLRLVAFVEAEFGIEVTVPDVRGKSFESIDSIASLVTERMQAAAAAVDIHASGAMRPWS